MTLTLQPLEKQREMISIESIGMQKMNKFASGARLPKFISTFAEFASDTFEDMNFTIRGLVSPRELEKLVKKAKYASIMDVNVYRPEGMVGSYIQTLDVLEDWERRLADVEQRLVKPLTMWIAELLTSSEKLSKISTKNFSTVDVVGLKKEMKRVIDVDDQGEFTKYGTAVRNNAEWYVVAERTNALVERFATINLKDLKASVAALVENASMLSDRMKDNPDQYQVSGKVLDEIVNTIYHVSEEVEMVSLLGYRIQSVATSIEDNKKRLKEIL